MFLRSRMVLEVTTNEKAKVPPQPRWQEQNTEEDMDDNHNGGGWTR